MAFNIERAVIHQGCRFELAGEDIKEAGFIRFRARVERSIIHNSCHACRWDIQAEGLVLLDALTGVVRLAHAGRDERRILLQHVEPGDRKKVRLSSNVGSQKGYGQTQGRQVPPGSKLFHTLPSLSYSR